MSYDFTEVMAGHTDKKLAAILTSERDQYQAAAIEAAQKEFDSRNLTIGDFSQPTQEDAQENGGYNIQGTMATVDTGTAAPAPVSNAEHEVAKREQANKDILYGLLWCVGGIAATAADIGFIFWGAIVYGGIQFFKGLSNS